jgi:cytidine deaminase
MTTQTHPVDHELIQAAAHMARTRCRGDNHTMAAAARARDGRIVTAVNAYHFTGGPCAEPVLISAAAAQGGYDRGLSPPCGRCRQVLPDYFPALKVIVGEDDRLRTARVTDLLPESYVWADHQLDAEKTTTQHELAPLAVQQGESPLMRPRSRTRRWSSSYTLALAHAEKRRWAVASDGNCCHGQSDVAPLTRCGQHSPTRSTLCSTASRISWSSRPKAAHPASHDCRLGRPAPDPAPIPHLLRAW